MLTKLHFSRFEFKYILSPAVRREVESELGYFLQLDPYVEAKPHKKYLVRSLYFDDPVLSNFRDKTDGMLHRAKFRLRTYTNDPQEGCATFLEVKGRHNALVFKHRVALSRGERGRFQPGEDSLAQQIVQRAAPGEVLQRFRYELARKRLAPVMLIDYQRRPYVSKYDAEFRLTFDEELSGTHTQCLYPHPWEPRRAILRGYSVMEVKFRFHVPSWFHRIIQSYNLRRVSVSKVCYGMEACGLAEDI